MRENQYGLCLYALAKTELKITGMIFHFSLQFSQPVCCNNSMGRANKIDQKNPKQNKTMSFIIVSLSLVRNPASK